MVKPSWRVHGKGRSDGAFPHWAPPALAMLIVLAGAAFLRVPGLTEESLWLDEVYSVHVARQPLAAVLFNAPRDVHPPLYYLLLHAWFAVMGVTDWTARCFSVICGMGVVGVLGAAAWRLYGPTVGALVAAFAGVLPPLVEYSREARMYALLVLCVALALTHALIWHRTRSSRSGRAFALSVAAALWTHYSATLFWVAVACGYGLYLRRKDAKQLRHWMLLNAVPAAAILLWLPVFLTQWQRRRWNAYLFEYESPTLGDLVEFLTQSFGLSVRPPRLGFSWGLIPAGEAWGLVGLSVLWVSLMVFPRSSALARRRAKDRRGEGLLLASAGILPLLLAFGVSQYRNLWLARCLQMALPGLIVLLVTRLLPHRSPLWSAALGAILLASSIQATQSSIRTPHREEWREAAEELRRHRQPGDVIAVTAPYTIRCLWHYGIAGQDLLPVYPETQQTTTRADVLRLSRNAKRVWLW
jgi:mannosyltransferase